MTDQLPPKVIRAMYARRFEGKHEARLRMWKVLCDHFFQRYVSETDAVLDLGAGCCEFINQVRCRRKVALDLNEDVIRFAGQDVEVIQGSVLEKLADLTGGIDVVFASHFFEHLATKEMMVDVLLSVKSSLRFGGRLLIFGPNMRFAYDRYWDLFDHHIPLSDLSMAEILRAVGFEILEVLPRFLPYNRYGWYPRPLFVWAYLQLPFLYRVFGRQFFIVARKPPED